MAFFSRDSGAFHWCSRKCCRKQIGVKRKMARISLSVRLIDEARNTNRPCKDWAVGGGASSERKDVW